MYSSNYNAGSVAVACTTTNVTILSCPATFALSISPREFAVCTVDDDCGISTLFIPSGMHNQDNFIILIFSLGDDSLLLVLNAGDIIGTNDVVTLTLTSPDAISITPGSVTFSSTSPTQSVRIRASLTTVPNGFATISFSASNSLWIAPNDIEVSFFTSPFLPQTNLAITSFF